LKRRFRRLVAEEFEIILVNGYYQDNEQQKKQKKIQHAVSFLSCVIYARHGGGLFFLTKIVPLQR
jgi:hypothetical protein